MREPCVPELADEAEDEADFEPAEELVAFEDVDDAEEVDAAFDETLVPLIIESTLELLFM